MGLSSKIEVQRFEVGEVRGHGSRLGFHVPRRIHETQIPAPVHAFAVLGGLLFKPEPHGDAGRSLFLGFPRG